MSDVTRVPLRPIGKGGLAALWLGIVVLLCVGIAGAVMASRKPAMAAMPATDFLIANGKRKGVLVTDSGLQYQVIKPGAGATPGESDVAEFDYKGTLTNGIVFDETKPGQPVQMQVGQVVPGFAEALMLMPKGSRYRVWIPPQLGYGDHATGPIPAGSVLVFDITMHNFGQPQQEEIPPQEGLAQQEGAPQEAPAEAAAPERAPPQ